MVHKYNTTGTGGSKFGIQTDDLDDVVKEIKSEPLIQLIGIHCHLGSTITKIEIFRYAAEIFMNVNEIYSVNIFITIKLDFLIEL